MVQQPLGVGPFWPHTSLGEFWPVSQLDSLWDVAIHTEVAPFVPKPFVDPSPAKAEGGFVAGTGAGGPLAGDLAQYCQPVGLGETKYQCTLCRKLFRGPEYVFKHVQEKHRTASGGYAAEPYTFTQPGAPAAQRRHAAPAAAAAAAVPAAKSSAPGAPAVAAAPAAAAAPPPAAATAEGSLADKLLLQADFLIEEVGPEAAEAKVEVEPLIEEIEADSVGPATTAPAAAEEGPTAPVAFAPAEPEVGPAVGGSEGERWTCSKCQETNKASREHCNNCGAARPEPQREPEAEQSRQGAGAVPPASEEPAVAEASANAEEPSAKAEAAGPRSIEDLCKVLGSSKFQCAVCSKMFKGPDFVYKHLRQKHPAEVEALASAPGAASATAGEPGSAPATGPPAGPECLQGDDVEGDLLQLVEVPPIEQELDGRKACNDPEATIAFDDEAAAPASQGLSLPDAAAPSAQMGIDESVLKREDEPQLARGSKVEVTGLSGRADLNGCKGEVTLKEGTTGRFEVKIDSSGERVRVKPENLVLLAVKQSEKKGWADAAFKEGSIEQAIGLYNSALQDDMKGDAELEGAIRSNLSAAYARKKDYQRALEEANLALSLRPSWATAHSRRGFGLLGLGRLAEAQSTYTKALQFDPVNEGGIAGLGQVTDQLAKDSNPSGRQSEAETKRAKGREAARVGDLPTAVAFYTMAIALLRPSAQSTSELQHRFAVYCSSRSAVFAKLQHWRFAFADAQEAKRLSPNWFKAHARAAFALLGMGHAELSFRAYLDVGDMQGGQAEAAKDLQQAMWKIPAMESPLAVQRMGRFEEDRGRPPGSCRLFAISGVHVDQALSAMPWAEGISSTEFTNDILLVSSLGDTVSAVKRGLAVLKSKFRRVFYVPGNHDLWIRPDSDDCRKRKLHNSVEKLLALLDVCDELGAETTPAEVMENVFVVPLLSWWTRRFGGADSQPNGEKYDSFCSWPMGEEGAHKYFLRWNEPSVKRVKRTREERLGKCDVVSFSHFLPTSDIPTWEVPKQAAGCGDLEAQVKTLGSRLHLFGHTRRSEVHEIRGVTYQQHALMGPDYSHSSQQVLLKVYDGGLLLPGREHDVY